MARSVLLLLGGILVIFQEYIIPIDTNKQFIIFLSGIVLLGLPHGAADLLVANRTADADKKSFSKIRFLAIYLSRLFLFAAILWFFPVAGNFLFILFAAYHFGETDLHQFDTNSILGKIFVISYGLLILSVILLHHFDDVKTIFHLFESGRKNASLINWIDIHRYHILSAAGILFFTISFVYFLINGNNDTNEKGQFLIRFAIILLILFNLPMLLGFTFYFVVWHSILSLRNIIHFLRNNNTYSLKTITYQIIFYSVLAIAGIGMFGLTGSMFINNDAIAGYIFLGLAVLTAPHMQIMHDMYTNLRNDKSATLFPEKK